MVLKAILISSEPMDVNDLNIAKLLAFGGAEHQTFQLSANSPDLSDPGDTCDWK